jgi:hypothetical protein
VRITSIADGFLWPGLLFTKLSEWMGVFGLLVIAVLLGVVWYFYMRNAHAWEVAAGAPDEK